MCYAFSRWKRAFTDQQPHFDEVKLLERLKSAWSLPAEERQYCPQCEVLLGEGEEEEEEEGCGGVQGTTDAQEKRCVSSGDGVSDGVADPRVKEKVCSHKGHGVIEGITDEQLEDPTTLLNPMDDRKAQAVRCACTHIHTYLKMSIVAWEGKLMVSAISLLLSAGNQYQEVCRSINA